jgi:hypothetical protein
MELRLDIWIESETAVEQQLFVDLSVDDALAQLPRIADEHKPRTIILMTTSGEHVRTWIKPYPHA